MVRFPNLFQCCCCCCFFLIVPQTFWTIEDLDYLKKYIDECYDRIIRGKSNAASTPAASKASSSKRSRNKNSPGAISAPGKDQADVLLSIDNRLSSVEARLSLLELFHREFQALQESLEFSQQQVQVLATENAALKESVKSLTEGLTQL